MKRILVVCAGAVLAFGLAGSNLLAAERPGLTLDESIKLALANNHLIKIAIKDQEVAVASLQEARTGKLPVVNFTHSDSRLKPNPSDPAFKIWNIDPPVTNYFDNQLTVKLLLYTGGQVEGYIKQAEWGVKIADFKVAQTRQQVQLDITVAYYNVLQAKSFVKLSEEAVERLTAHLKSVQARYNAELVTRNEVLRSEVALADAEEELIKARNGYNLATANLNYVMGMELSNEVNVWEKLTYSQFDQPFDTCVTQAVQQRPEIAQLKAYCQVTKTGVQVARSGSRPTVAMVGTLDQNDSDFAGTDNSNWSMSMVASWDLYDSGRTKSRVEQAQVKSAQAEETLLQAQDGVRLEVRQAYLNLKEAEERIHTSELSLNKATEDFQLVRARYNAGLGTNLDVIDAQLATTAAQTNHINALYDYNVSMAKLKKAMGDVDYQY